MDERDERQNIGAGAPRLPGSEMPWDGWLVPARIYRPARSAMQSGPGRKVWVLEFERTLRPRIEPLMGWTTGEDPFANLRLYFPDLKSAVAFAERQGWPYSVEEPPSQRVAPKSYADHFKYDLRMAMERAASNTHDMTASSLREQILSLGGKEVPHGKAMTRVHRGQ
jgi:hypothetical protein